MNMNKIKNKFKGKKRSKDDDDQASEHLPRIKVTRIDEPLCMDLDFSNVYQQQQNISTPSPSSPCPSPSYSTYSNFSTISTHSTYSNMNMFNPMFNNNNNNNNQQLFFFPQETSLIPNYIPSQEENELNRFKMMSIDNIVDLTRENTSDTAANINLMATSTFKGVCSVAQNFGEFIPLIDKFIKLGEEVLLLYEKAKHNKELCGFLLNRCNCAMAAVRDLNIRKTENTEFFSKEENLRLFREFIRCMEKIRKFVSRISKLHKLLKYFAASNIEQDFNDLILEFDGYMRSLNFSFIVQSRDEISKMRNDIRDIKDMLINVYGVPDDKQALIEFSNRMDQLTMKNINFQTSARHAIEDSSEIEANEPLLDGTKYQRSYIHTKKIEKRTLYSRCEEFCFKEFANNTSPPDQSQFEIRRQVNILKELKDSDHIIRFFGVAHEDSKFYLVTEWMEFGNLHEYYTDYSEIIDWNTKIKFALDICRGVAYLHECKILHHDIQSTNILVNRDCKVKIANFGLSKKFSDITRNITHNLENIRYMAPEKLLLDNDDDRNNHNVKKKKVPYDSKCEIYSVGTLLWEIAELKKPHSDLNKADMLVSIRKRVSERYSLPFSNDVPIEWRFIVARAMEYEPSWRLNISDICRDFYNLSKKYQQKSLSYDSSMFNFEFNESGCFDEPIIIDDDDDSPSNQNQNIITITILSVDDAIREHKSKNGNKRLAWESFKHHSSTSLEAKYWLGYYYFHDKEIPELLQIDKRIRIKTAVEIFKETADKGNPSAQLRYGICLWQGDGVNANSFEALKYLKKAAGSGNSAAMFIIGKAYWNGGNGVVKDRNQGAEYLKRAALNNHPKAKEMCIENNINYNI
ncbi:uncharacterized protein OCT59_006882 [Rhizophagus irregularis]|uniref:Protein kinase domain-containing protein n=10 Tax=Rhizophagus irregularis TaxID=588596 RepID=A0A915ZT02_9GLOM|nr:Mkk2p [Rhizophagus irregularis DAOM 197198w]UZO15461.1 hypothetical protein OCT59_006882 [Rhizophagus irregularis]CAB4474333.1 unnamed protein product [Rhizophagus irregularis]CAB5388710.1 unnamed protein product [Rhizophagus irregularis]